MKKSGKFYLTAKNIRICRIQIDLSALKDRTLLYLIYILFVQPEAMIIKIKYLGYFLFFVVLRVNSFNKFKMELFSNLKKMWQEQHYYSYSHFMFLFNCQTVNDVKYIFYLWLHFSFTENNSFYYHQADSFSIDLFQPFASVW